MLQQRQRHDQRHLPLPVVLNEAQELLQAEAGAGQEVSQTNDVVYQNDYVEILMRMRLLLKQRIAPPSTGQPDLNLVGRKVSVDADDVFCSNNLASSSADARSSSA